MVCSVACRGMLQRSEKPGSASNVRYWLNRRGFILKCARCGFDEPREILAVHHRDHNRRNNAPENLEILCPNCHAIEHFILKPRQKAATVA